MDQRWSRGHKARGQGHKKIRGQGQPFRGQTLSMPRTKDTSASVLQKKKKKVFTKIFQAISTKKRFPNFQALHEILTIQKIAGQFSRT